MTSIQNAINGLGPEEIYQIQSDMIRLTAATHARRKSLRTVVPSSLGYSIFINLGMREPEKLDEFEELVEQAIKQATFLFKKPNSSTTRYLNKKYLISLSKRRLKRLKLERVTYDHAAETHPDLVSENTYSFFSTSVYYKLIKQIPITTPGYDSQWCGSLFTISDSMDDVIDLWAKEVFGDA